MFPVRLESWILEDQKCKKLQILFDNDRHPGPASLVSLFRLMAVAFENGQIHQAK